MYCDHYHARSIDSNNHPSRNWVKGLWGNIRHDIPEGWRICGENIYAKHSIFYEDLDTYFEVFSIWDDNNKCLSWDNTVVWAELLGLKTVPVLHRGKFNLALIKKFHETLNLEKQEGFVIRNVKGFHYNDADKNIAKWVRKGHVQTSDHWMHGKVIPNLLKSKNEYIYNYYFCNWVAVSCHYLAF